MLLQQTWNMILTKYFKQRRRNLRSIKRLLKLQSTNRPVMLIRVRFRKSSCLLQTVDYTLSSPFALVQSQWGTVRGQQSWLCADCLKFVIRPLEKTWTTSSVKWSHAEGMTQRLSKGIFDIDGVNLHSYSNNSTQTLLRDVDLKWPAWPVKQTFRQVQQD